MNNFYTSKLAEVIGNVDGIVPATLLGVGLAAGIGVLEGKDGGSLPVYQPTEFSTNLADVAPTKVDVATTYQVKPGEIKQAIKR